MTGAAATVNVVALDVAPAQGFATVTDTVPAVVTSAAGTVTVSWVAEEDVGVRFVPPKLTTEPETKFVPVRVKVKSALPGAMQFGLSEVIVGLVPTVIIIVAVPVLHGPAPLVALILTVNVPVLVGVPERTFWFCPLPCDNHEGSPVAE
jgi:hypothetical protein